MGVLVLWQESLDGSGWGIAGLFSALFCGIVVAFWALGLHAARESRRNLDAFHHAPVTTQATILDREVKRSKDRYEEREWCTYWVVFGFDVRGRQVPLRARVSRPLHECLEPGTRISVRYAAADPRIALLEGEDGYSRVEELAAGAERPVREMRGPATPAAEAVPVEWPFWLQWALASVVGRAIGPVVRDAIGRAVSGLGSQALVAGVGGLVAGATIGALQWLVLRRRARQAGWWILASAAGAGVAEIAMQELWIDTGFLAEIEHLWWGAAALVVGGTVGAVAGAIEWLALRRWVREAGWWVPASSVAAVVGNVVAGPLAALPWHLDLVLNAAVCETLRGLVLAWLLENPRS